MLNRWNKLVAIAALALALPVVANAQTSRVEGMSIQNDYVKDYTNIHTYVSGVSHVGNLVYGEFGSGFYDRSVGAVLGNLFEGRTGTWAIHLRETTPSLGQGDTWSHPGTGVGGWDNNTNNNHSFDIMWGKRFGGTSLGARLNRSFGEWESSTPTTMTTITLPDSANFMRNLSGISGGIGFEINPSTMFEGSVLYQTRTFERTAAPIGGNTNASDDKPAAYMLAARMMWQWQPNVMVTPVLKYYSYDYSVKRTVGSTTTTSDATQKGWQLGVAGNWTLNQNDLFVLGLTAARNTVDQDGPLFSAGPFLPGSPGGAVGAAADNKKIEESIYPQIFAALETHVNPWLTLRFGATQDVYAKVKAEPRANTSNKVTATFTRFNMELGCGVKVGGLQFDAIMDPNFYNTFTTVSSEDAPVFPKVTATYAF